MPLRDGTFLQCASEITEYLKVCKNSKNNPDKKVISDYIYSALTRRDSSKKIKSIYAKYESVEPLYAKAIYYLNETLFYNEHFKAMKLNVQYDRYWYNISLSESTRPNTILGIFKVMHKEYFTFSPSPQANTPDLVIKEIVKFVELIPKLIDRLYLIGLQAHDNINIKFPFEFHRFIQHPDSLVIHYKDKKLSPVIRQIVNDEFANAGISSRRRTRAKTGFDFQSIQDKSWMTHTDLISKIIADDLLQNLSQMKEIETVRIAEWIRSKVAEVSQWDENKIHSKLRI